jgi:hypothetical protein
MAQVNQAETFTALNKTGFNTFSLQHLDSAQRYTMVTVSFFELAHPPETVLGDEGGIHNTVYRKLAGRWSLGAGVYYHSVAGFRERITVLRGYQAKNLSWLTLISLSYLNEELHGEWFTQLRYNKTYASNWGIFAMLNASFDYTQFKVHSRSFQHLRLGPSYKNVQFGALANFDRYGPDPLIRDSFGVFFSMSY